MLFKWIVCSVSDDTKELFSLAQTKWAGLASIRGFIGQLGGWDLKSENEACILGIWQHAEAYNTFMDEHHDKIFQDNEQAKTYQAINTVLLHPVYKMPGAYKDMSDSLGVAKAIRVPIVVSNQTGRNISLTFRERFGFPVWNRLLVCLLDRSIR